MGWLSAIATFAVSWIYCMDEYGFLFGFGLGWLPSAMLAAIVGWLVRWLWPVAAFFLVLALLRSLF